MDYDTQLESATNVKHNLSGYDSDNLTYDRVVRDKVRVWHKILKTNTGSTEVINLNITFPLIIGVSSNYNVILPTGTLYEPFYDTSDINMNIDKCGEWNNTEYYFELYSDILGVKNVLESNIITLEHGRKVSKILLTPYVYDEDGNEVKENLLIEIYNGKYWIPISLGNPISFDMYNGADLDADLDADLYIDLNNYDYSTNSFQYQNVIKYRIKNLNDFKVIVKKVILKIIWEF